MVSNNEKYFKRLFTSLKEAQKCYDVDNLNTLEEIFVYDSYEEYSNACKEVFLQYLKDEKIERW